MKTNFLILILFLGGALMAQDYSANVIQSVNESSTRYDLDDKQRIQMFVIEERRERNLAEIETLRATDHPLFLQKKQAIRKNTTGSIHRMLTEDQRLVLGQEKLAYRIETSDLIRQYRSEGKNKSEIELLLLERG